VISVRGPQAAQGNDGDYVPTATALPYTLSFSNPSEQPAGQLRIVTELDADLDIRSLRLGDLKIGDINVHVPVDRANFQGDFDFTGSKGFVLRVSAGIDASTRIATWLLQAIDPDTGEVLHDATRGLLAPATDPNAANADQLKRGFVSYTVMAADTAVSRAEIAASARILIDDAPPVESERVAVKLDAAAPTTTLAVTALGNDSQGAPNFDVRWTATDDASGVKSVTVYVSEDGGDFKIWLRQVAPTQTQAVYTGSSGQSSGKHYEFLAVATDKAGNGEAASVANAVLPDDGSRQEILDALGVNTSLSQTAELPLAAADRSYAANPLFAQAIAQLPGQVASNQTGDLSSVLAPFSLRGFADGFNASAADIGALAMVELPDHRILASAGSLRNEVFAYDKDGGSVTQSRTTPLFTLDEPVMDMAVDRYGQLWVMTGAELLQVDPNDGTVLQRLKGPGQDPLTHALAIHPATGDIYVSSGNGIEVFNPNAVDSTKAWKHFSNQRVGDLAFAPDGRLWAVTWTGSRIDGAQPGAITDIVSFPMTGRTAGRPELEYRLAGLIDSISFGADGTPLAGLLLASSNLKQRAVVEGAGDIPHQSSVWMLELATKRILQVASGGTRGESIVTTADGRILVAQTGHIDEIAVRPAPTITAITVPDGSLVPLPLNQIGIVFDQAMWQGDAADTGSILNPANFTLTLLDGGTEAAPTLNPQAIRWDAATRTAWLDVAGLPAGRYQLDISSQLRNSTDTRLEHGYLSTFTALLDMTSQIRVDFSNTRADRATGQVSYDVSLTNIGTDDLRGPITLLLDPGRYFAGSILDADLGGPSDDLWTLDLTAALQLLGGELAVGATLANQTVTVTPASNFATRAGMADLVKFNLGQSIYAAPQDNLPPALTVAGLADADTLDAATVGQAWSGQIEAIDPDGTKFYWQLLQAPAGVSLTPPTDILADLDGYHAVATLNWTPTASADINTEIVVRVQDSRGGVAIRRFQVPVIGGNTAPVIDAMGGVGDITLAEGETLSLPLTAADADGDRLTLTVRNLPPGAVFDAATGLLTWTPGYDQAGTYDNITLIASDGRSGQHSTVSQRFSVTVEQGWAKPVLAAVAPQTLREGEKYGLQLAGSLPSGLSQADGGTVTLDYSSPWLPGGATLNSETGWLEWTPGFSQHGTFTLPVTLTATYTTFPPLQGEGQGGDGASGGDGNVVTTSVTRDIVFNVLNANGAPIFVPSETWNILEGQHLRVSVFAFDPDNPDFEPKIRLRPGTEAIGPETTAPTVSYQVTGLPAGASFDAETMEIVWTPGYVQAGSYSITVTATDDGDGTGTPAVSQLILPIVVNNANRAPEIGDISNAFVNKNEAIEIPVFATDADGNPLTLALSGLPHFATYTQNPSTPGAASGVIRFTPGEGDRGDYTITVAATDDGGGDVNQTLTQAKSFVLTVKSDTEAPVITAPRQVVAVVGQAFSLPLLVSDADQDALIWSANGLPIGAAITPDVQYGHAVLTWTPTADDLGARDIELIVTDSGLPPQDAGIVNPENPIPNVTRHTLRLVVRDANAAPELLDVQVNGQSVTAIVGAGGTAIQLNATEGVPLSLELFGHDSDIDLIDWSAATLPRGMSLSLPSNDDTTRAVLAWTPDRFAAQDSNTGTMGDNPGLWRFTVTGSDGTAQFVRSFEITVTNVNQTPRILPMPLQLVNEGETLSFTLRAADADNDAVGINLVRDADGANAVPTGVIFDSATGTFEWTPDQATVDNATVSD
ncbi:MAG: putative Ig domain-containing protein, partial [Sulfuritalea sp.]|nr:putative Ig domain-containing protein [Sulfuritalea sp.]